MAHRAARTRGVTLVELIVVIVVLAVLAAYALPAFVSLDTRARIAAVQGLAGAIDATAYQTRALCMATAQTSGCNLASSSWRGTINGKGYWLNYGWPDAGDALAADQIDGLVDYGGFTATLVSNAETQFQMASAPTPAHCSISYYDAFYGPPKYHYVIDTSGC